MIQLVEPEVVAPRHLLGPLHAPHGDDVHRVVEETFDLGLDAGGPVGLARINFRSGIALE
ncbi:MAG: hypothetical protein KF901_10720 [Myxococcales bacterium]|nr:hypothetical protein [Myxococcales bacterium]